MALRPRGPDRPSSGGRGRLGVVLAVGVLVAVGLMLWAGVLADREQRAPALWPSPQSATPAPPQR